MTLLPKILPWGLLLVVVAGCPDKSEPSDTDSGTSAGPSSSSTGGGEASPCQEICEHLLACGSFFAPSMLACLSTCTAELNPTDACREASSDFWTCLGEAPCDDQDVGPNGACKVPYADQAISCFGCPTDADSSDTADTCSAIVECPHLVHASFLCEGDTCTCAVEGEAFTTCPAAETCAGDDAAILDAATACCEIPFVMTVPPGS